VTWQPGRDRIAALIEAAELQRVTADADIARLLLDDAGRHLATSAAGLSSGDLSGAYQLAYDALRKSAASLLEAQGLRATRSLLVGLRTEEARALRWDHVVVWVAEPGEWRPVTEPQFANGWPDVARFAIYVWRAERHGGDTKTGKFRRTPALRRRCVDVLREQRNRLERERARAGELWRSTA
jgi:hypothetical protein